MLWALAYGQADGMMLLWARDYTQRVVLGVELAPSAFAAIPPAFVLLWTLLAALFRSPGRSVPRRLKIQTGLFATSAGFGLMVLAVPPSGHLASAAWPLACLALLTVGELLVVPVTQVLINRLAPHGRIGLGCAVWYAAAALGLWLAGQLAALSRHIPHAAFFAILAVAPLAAAVLLACQRSGLWLTFRWSEPCPPATLHRNTATDCGNYRWPERPRGSCWLRYNDLLIGGLVSRDQARSTLAEESILESVSDAVFVLDQDFVVTFYNSKAEVVLGRSRAEVLGRKLFDAFPEARGSVFDERYGRAVREQKKDSFEVFFDIEPFRNWYEVRVHPHDGGIVVFFQIVTERKALEERLQKSETLLRNILDSTTDCIFAKDLQGRYLLFNASAEAAVGKKAPEVLGKDDRAIFSEADAAAVREFDRGAQERVIQGEEIITTAGGKQVIYLSTKGPLRDPSGEVFGIFGFARDITARKRMEEALRIGEGRLRAMFEQSPLGIATIDSRNGRFLEINDAYCRILGLSREEALRCDWKSVTHPDDIQADLDNMAALHAGKVGWFRIEKRYRRPDGTLVCVSLTVAPLVSGRDGLESHVAMAEDVTDRKAAQEELQQALSTLSLAQKYGQTGIWDWDIPSGRLTWSAELRRLFGLGSDAPATFATWEAVVHPDDLRQIKEKIERSVADRAPLVDEYRVVRADGSAVWILTKGSVSCGPGGTPLRMTGVCIDVTDLKRAEESARFNEERLQAVLDNSGTVCFIKDLQGRYLMVNRLHERLFHLKREDIKGKTDYDIFPKEHADHFTAHDRKALEVGGPIDVEEVAPHDDGLHTYISVKFPMAGPDGRFYGVCGISTDITERKRAEKALRVSEEKFQKAFHSSPLALGITRLSDGKFIEANEGLASTLGFGVPEVLGRTTPELNIWWNPEDRAKYISALKRDGAVRNMEVEVRVKSGEHRTMIMSSEPIEIEGQACMLSTFFDITDRKKADQAVRASEEKYRALVETTDTGFLILDGKGRVVDANAEYVRLTGRKGLEEIAGRTVVEWTAAHHQDEYRAAVERCMRDRGIRNLNIDYAGPDGKLTPVEINAAVIGEGDSLRIVSLIRDASLRKKAEEAQRTLQKLESVGTLAGGIAHDFNNLLTGILGSLSLLGEDLQADADKMELLREAQGACHTAKGLARQLLTFASGGVPVLQVEAIEPIVREAATFAARGSNVRVEFSRSCGACGKVDRDQLAQVVQNLVLNAVQAMPMGGVISLDLDEVELPGGEVPGLSPGRYARLRVRDRGAGIPGNVLPRIFDPYYSTKSKGRGLGLAVCHSIVTKHGGAISAESTPGEGATFTVHLPAVVAAAAPKAAPASAKSRLSGRRVLVMDDEELVGKVLKLILTRLGAEAELTPDGAAALAVCRRATEAGRPFDLVIADLTVPGGMGGLELAAALAMEFPGLKVLVSSGYSTAPVLADLGSNGFCGVLPKPYVLEDVAEAIKKALGLP